LIGAVLLAVGLLLILSGFAAAWIPGGATWPRPGIGRFPGPGDADAGIFAFARRGENPIQAFVMSPVHPATWYANAGIVLGALVAVIGFGTIASAASAGFTTLVGGVGVLFFLIAIEGARLVARVERRRAWLGESGRPLAHPYRPLRGGGVVGFLRAEFADESRWRDLLYVAVNLPLALIEFVVVAVTWTVALSLLTMPVWYDAVGAPPVAELGPLASHDLPVVLLRTLAGAALLPVAASLSQLLFALHRAVVRALLCTSESRELRRQVETLRKSRSDVLAVEASELHRIERDLHDGAQQRLVMLSIDLGLASERVETDPEAAKQLILDGQEQARAALAEIRSLVRGIAPSILLDRGLVPALESILAHGPVPTVLVNGLRAGERLPAATERAAYFVVTEALANVAKHSEATRCEVRCRREDGRLVVEVWDDGKGGARAEPGGGLAGLASRIAGVDGTFTVSSPEGGPTVVRAEIPLGAPAPSTWAAYDPR
jgi:signal transduction histidine kinase